MPIPDNQWISVAPTEFPHEQEAFDFIKRHAREVVGAWSNFEFVTPEGKVYEIDLMLLTLTELYLVEIKSWSGILEGTSNNMTRRPRGNPEPRPVANPLLLLNKKAKILAGMLKGQKSLKKGYIPFVNAVVFFNNKNLEMRIRPEDRPNIFYRDEFIQGILPTQADKDDPRKRMDLRRVKALNKAFQDLGIRPPSRTLKVGEWVIKELLEDGDLHQDHLAQHQSLAQTFRRVRTFSLPNDSTKEQQALARRAAEREFKLTDSLNHPGVLKPYNYVEHELGPALVYPYDEKAERLDHYLATHDGRLGPSDRLELLQQLADVLRYAHTRRIYHRGLAPQAILVFPQSRGPELRVMDWRTGMEKDVTTGTSHISDLMDKGAKAYLAPEAFHRPSEASGILVDIFGLGAVAFHILTGSPPAETHLELYQKLTEHPGLRLSSVTDGLGPELEALVEMCTHPVAHKRPSSIEEVIELLELATKASAKTEEEVINPLEAQSGAQLPGGYTVVRRLGKGASALALEVVKDEINYVLKVAHSPEHNEQMLREGETVQALDHPHIVKCHDVEEIGGRCCLVLQKAGDETLARRLSEQGPLQLGLLERFGQDLLKAVLHLEEVGVRHRDIKPANLGVTLLRRDDALHLMLFDFSLAGVSDDNIEAGTRDYIDPFLRDKKPPRWDPSAERYSAAITLHEMATGTLPRWGDGKTHPGLDPQAQLVLESERFDPSVRENLTKFFTKALARHRAERFHNAEEMLQAWSRAFKASSPVEQETHWDSQMFERALEQATLDTTLAALGLEVRALRATEHLKAYTVADFLALSSGALHTASGVGNKTRKRLVELQARLKEKFEEQLLEQTEAGAETEDRGLLEAFLVPVLGSGSAAKLKESYLGLDQPPRESGWPTLVQVARQRQLDPMALAREIPGWRRQWCREPSLRFLRNGLAILLEENGGVVSAGEVALGLLSRHGSFSNERDRRLQLANALARAAIEAEQTDAEPRFLWERVGRGLVVTQNQAQVLYLKRLAEVADRCARQEPLLSPGRAAEEVRAVEAPEGMANLSTHRLLRLAALCSETAAVSSREEFYPRQMPAQRALILAHGALLGPGELSVSEVQARVQARYPEAEPLPERPELDALLAHVDPDLYWSESKESYQRRVPLLLSTAGSSGSQQRFSTTDGTRPAGHDPEIAEARRFEERLQHALRDQDFLILMVEPHLLDKAEEELLRRFELTRHNLSHLLLASMRDRAASKNVPWEKMLLGDAEQQGKAWKVLSTRLVPDAMTSVEERLLNCERPQLLVNPSLLARYQQLSILEKMRDLAGTREGLAAVWLLLPSEDTARAPTLEGQAVPILHSGQKAAVPESWVVNAHRTAREKLASS